VIKAVLTHPLTGDKFILLGLTDESFEALRKGEAITFDGTPMGLIGKVHIVWGHTEIELANALGIPIPN
jgi:hypothetical protein